MRWTHILGLLLVVIIGSGDCVSGRAAVSTDPPNEEMTFVVASVESEILEGVDVLRVRGGEFEHLGATDGLGSFSIGRDELRAQDVAAVVFCMEGYFCGALRLDQEAFFEYDEHFIALAPFMVR